jgi:hypothetical protein
MTAAARQAGFTAVTAAAEELPFTDGSFDTPISGWASMRYTDQSRSFPEAARVLRPGGTVTFTFWNFQLSNLLGKIGFWRHGRLAPANFNARFRDKDVSDIRGLEQKLADAGLPVEAIRTTIFPSGLARLLQPLLRYYRGRLGSRLGYNIIISCRRTGGTIPPQPSPAFSYEFSGSSVLPTVGKPLQPASRLRQKSEQLSYWINATYTKKSGFPIWYSTCNILKKRHCCPALLIERNCHDTVRSHTVDLCLPADRFHLHSRGHHPRSR